MLVQNPLSPGVWGLRVVFQGISLWATMCRTCKKEQAGIELQEYLRKRRSEQTTRPSNTEGWCRLYDNFLGLLKVAFSRKGLWKHIFLRFFINFSSKFFNRTCDWLDVNSNSYPQPITSYVKKFKGKIEEKLEQLHICTNLIEKKLPLLRKSSD